MNFYIPQWELEDLKRRKTKATSFLSPSNEPHDLTESSPRSRPALLRLVVPTQIWIEDDILTLELKLTLKTIPMNHLPSIPSLTEAQIHDSFLTVHYVELEPSQSNIHRPEDGEQRACLNEGVVTQ